MKKTLATLIIGAIVGLGGAAVAADAFTPPPTPDWMNRPCATPDHFYVSNCYWNGEQMGTGTGPSYYVRNFEVQSSTGVQRTIRCYFYSQPTTTGSTVDHCVRANVDQEPRVAGWIDPSARRHH